MDTKTKPSEMYTIVVNMNMSNKNIQNLNEKGIEY
jgi:hypothetical protein